MYQAQLREIRHVKKQKTRVIALHCTGLGCEMDVNTQIKAASQAGLRPQSCSHGDSSSNQLKHPARSETRREQVEPKTFRES